MGRWGTSVFLRKTFLVNKLKLRSFRASSLPTYDFLHYILPCPTILLKIKVDLIERIFQRECSLYITCNARYAFFTSDVVRNYNLWGLIRKCVKLSLCS